MDLVSGIILCCFNVDNILPKTITKQWLQRHMVKHALNLHTPCDGRQLAEPNVYDFVQFVGPICCIMFAFQRKTLISWAATGKVLSYFPSSW